MSFDQTHNDADKASTSSGAERTSSAASGQALGLSRMEHHAPEYVLGLLMLADTIERMDIPLMEIRHIQTNIIHRLGDPTLLRALRWEEFYIFGGAMRQPADQSAQAGATLAQTEEWWERFPTWYSVLKGKIDDAATLVALADAWVIPFPPSASRRDSLNNPVVIRYTDLESRQIVVDRILDETDRNWHLGFWRRDERRLHQLLSALQHIKRNILFDKLTIVRWGLNAFRIGETQPSVPLSPSEAEALNKFLLVRVGAMAGLRNHVERLGDLIDQYQNTIDQGRDDTQRPQVGRRREQGYYSNFLIQRARGFVRQSRRLLESIHGREVGSREAELSHSWQHSFSSLSHSIVDAVQSFDRRKDYPVFSVTILRSNYWMPDRPDLQLWIAHEAVHATLRELHPVDSAAHLTNDTPFAELLRHVNLAMPEGLANRGSYRNNRNVTTEIAVDLIASAITGPAYLYSFILELLGEDLEGAFTQLDHENIDLTIAEHITQYELDRSIKSFFWFLRLKVL